MEIHNDYILEKALEYEYDLIETYAKRIAKGCDEERKVCNPFEEE